HIAGTYDGSTVKLYVNGDLIDSVPASGTMQDYGKNVYFGRFTNKNAYTPGIIDEIRIYNRALSASEIQQLYNQGGGGNQPPAVSFLYPTGNERAIGEGIEHIILEANDPDGEIQKVEVKLNDGDWKEAQYHLVPLNIWAYSFDETILSKKNVIYARSIDNQDEYSDEVSISFDYWSYWEAPECWISYPEPADTIKGDIIIEGCSTSDYREVKHVWVSIDRGNWRLADGRNPWKFDLDTTYMEEGVHTIFAQAFDSYGIPSHLTWEDNLFLVYLDRYNNPPEARIIDIKPFPPKSGESFNLIGYGEDPDSNDEIVAYKWLDWGSTLGIESKDEYKCSGLSPGIHMLTLQVQDQWGAWSKPSSPVELEVVDCDYIIRPADGNVKPKYVTNQELLSWYAYYEVPDLVGGATSFHCPSLSDECYSMASANYKSGEVAAYVKGNTLFQSKGIARVGGKIDVGGSSDNCKYLKAKAKLISYGGKYKYTHSLLRLKGYVYGQSLGYPYGYIYFENDEEVDPFWEPGVFLDITVQFLSWLSIFLPTGGALVDILLNAISLSVTTYFQELARIEISMAFNQALNRAIENPKAGDKKIATVELEFPAVGTTLFVAELRAEENWNEGECYRYGQIEYILIDELDEPSKDLYFFNYCPTEVEIIDPGYRKINQTYSNIPGAKYLENDFNGDGEDDNLIFIPNPLNGSYQIKVVQK
ncbi:MAG TPA: hypothetical protein ENI44_01535, partial [Thermoplasmatales archaeon]|nr:hypothetical protein [Thermoplasmatales archaeon]